MIFNGLFEEERDYFELSGYLLKMKSKESLFFDAMPNLPNIGTPVTPSG